MSGIFGILNFDDRPVSEDQICKLSKALAEYGTEAANIWQAGQVGLGICLFATAKMINSSKPEAHIDRNVVLVFDGWISNRQEICKYLYVASERIKEPSDARLALEMYCLFGARFAAAIEGEFSIIIWDGYLKKMLAVTDVLGTRPLFFQYTAKYIAIATSIKALRLISHKVFVPNKNSLTAMLLNDYSFALTSTVFEDVARVPPGSTVLFTSGGVTTEKYLDLREIAVPIHASQDEQIELFRESFFHSVRETVREVTSPIGLQVSGGVDSSSVASTLRYLANGEQSGLKARLYSYQSTLYPSADERNYLTTLAQYCEPWPLKVLDFDQMWALKDNDKDEGFPLDEPEPPGLRRPQLDTMRTAAQDGCKILLNGYAGDQVLRADDPYLPHRFLWMVSDRTIREFFDLVHNYPASLWQALVFGFMRQFLVASMPIFFQRKIRTMRSRISKPSWILAAPITPSLTSTRSKRWDLRHAIVDACVNGAWQLNFSWLAEIGALTGIQMRFPFLNQRLLKILLRSKSIHLFQDGQNKWILRQALRGVLPEQIRNRSDWCISDDLIDFGLRFREKSKVEELLKEPRTSDVGLVEEKELRRAWQRYWAGDASEKHLLLSWLRTEIWLRGSMFS